MHSGTVLSLTRRQIKIWHNQEIFEFPIPRKFAELIPGDQVDIENQEIISYAPRKNILQRSLGHKAKEVATNIDLLLIVAAPRPLFNTSVIDRLLISADLEDIPVKIILNKSDQDYADLAPEIKYYEELGYQVINTSALSANGIKRLQDVLQDSQLKQVAMSGISGVGKSSILKQILQVSEIRTNEVSEKTGQGRQTTSRVEGYLVPNKQQIIYDVPGIQNFGLTHLTRDQIRLSFPDFMKHPCPYAGCQHLGEKECSVKAAVASGVILSSRYDSYQQIVDELIRNKEY